MGNRDPVNTISPGIYHGWFDGVDTSNKGVNMKKPVHWPSILQWELYWITDPQGGLVKSAAQMETDAQLAIGKDICLHLARISHKLDRLSLMIGDSHERG